MYTSIDPCLTSLEFSDFETIPNSCFKFLKSSSGRKLGITKIPFLISLFSFNSYSNETKRVSLLILDKSASTKHILNFNDTISYRDITFELLACDESLFDKYIDKIALMKINQKDNTFIGWFFKYTNELNLYSNKIYEITLKECIIEN